MASGPPAPAKKTPSLGQLSLPERRADSGRVPHAVRSPAPLSASGAPRTGARGLSAQVSGGGSGAGGERRWGRRSSVPKPATALGLDDQQREQIRQLFYYVDTHREGLISAEHARQLCYKLGYSVDFEDMDENEGLTLDDLLDEVDSAFARAQGEPALRLGQVFSLTSADGRYATAKDLRRVVEMGHVEALHAYGGELRDEEILSLLDAMVYNYRPDVQHATEAEFHDFLGYTGPRILRLRQPFDAPANETIVHDILRNSTPRPPPKPRSATAAAGAGGSRPGGRPLLRRVSQLALAERDAGGGAAPAGAPGGAPPISAQPSAADNASGTDGGTGVGAPSARESTGAGGGEGTDAPDGASEASDPW